MDLSVINELKEFESGQESKLEGKKRQFLKLLEEKKKSTLEKNEMELYEITSGRHNIIKKAQEKAKKDAKDTIDFFREKTKKLGKSDKKVEEAVNIIFKEFLGQNV